MSTRHAAPGLMFTTIACAVAVSFAQPTLAEMGDAPFNRMILFDQIEYGFNLGDNPLVWDSTSWIGGDWNRIWLKTEGEMATSRLEIDAEAQLLFSRLLAPFWEIQFGFRGDVAAADGQWPKGRGHLVLGLEGLAPYWFEVEPAIFVSHEGDFSARLRATYDLFITQRLIAHPSLEMNAALQSVPEFGVGTGLNDIELGLRIGYQLVREFTPYVGISFNQAFGETAHFRQAAGGSASDLRAVIGVRLWF